MACRRYFTDFGLRCFVVLFLVLSAFLVSGCGDERDDVPAPVVHASSSSSRSSIPYDGAGVGEAVVDIDTSETGNSQDAKQEDKLVAEDFSQKDNCSPEMNCFSVQKVVMLGDSRFVGMHNAVGDYAGLLWMSEVGAGSRLFFDNSDYLMALDKDTAIVYELGVNDLDASACVSALSSLVNAGFHNVWFSTVGPVDNAKVAANGYTITNDAIEGFNYSVLSNLPEGVRVIESYRFLMENGFESEDGLHYLAPTYKRWFEFVSNSVYGRASS